MKLLIHIGTQKTATTSIQRCCVQNRELLKSRGYLYPRNKIHPFLFNFLAEQLAQGEQGRVARYLQQVRGQGQREDCHTVIISAESFYAMALYFLYPRESSRSAEYWQIEARLIAELQRCCSEYDEVKIACYLRPQDDFASALYNQLVKISPYFSDTYEEFIDVAQPLFDYDRHIRLWEQNFGSDSISIRNFLACNKDVVEDFFDCFLKPEIYRAADKQESRANPRLNRDLLEFKRYFNKAKLDASLAYAGVEVHIQINPEFADRPGYQVLAPLDFRQNFFGAFAAGNDSLSQRYGCGDLPVLANRQEPTYPGLDPDRAFEIFMRVRSRLDKPGIRLKVALRRLEKRFADRVPGAGWLLSRLRKLRIRLSSRF